MDIALLIKPFTFLSVSFEISDLPHVRVARLRNRQWPLPKLTSRRSNKFSVFTSPERHIQWIVYPLYSPPLDRLAFRTQAQGQSQRPIYNQKCRATAVSRNYLLCSGDSFESWLSLLSNFIPSCPLMLCIFQEMVRMQMKQELIRW